MIAIVTEEEFFCKEGIQLKFALLKLTQEAQCNTSDILPSLCFLSGATLNVVAMALSGYTEEKKTMWRDMCRSLCGQVGSQI